MSSALHIKAPNSTLNNIWHNSRKTWRQYQQECKYMKFRTRHHMKSELYSCTIFLSTALEVSIISRNCTCPKHNHFSDRILNFPLEQFLKQKISKFWEEILKKCKFKGPKIKKNGLRKDLTAKYITHFHLQSVTSNNEIHQEIFEDLHRKCGANCKYEVCRSASGSFRVSVCRVEWCRER